MDDRFESKQRAVIEYLQFREAPSEIKRKVCLLSQRIRDPRTEQEAIGVSFHAREPDWASRSRRVKLPKAELGWGDKQQSLLCSIVLYGSN